MRKTKNQVFMEEDRQGCKSAVKDFNEHYGPARIFYNRNSKTFYTNCYDMGKDKWFGAMCNGIDIVELYRKTSFTPDIRVTMDELRMMEEAIGPYQVW